ncbi:MAG TPA: patatin-like phospholipase family protein [Xanthobacteraceae bacterium]|jgi:NTE family protein|nr:patatin-like phospholipase family protein [Xanthobacteraceae bacterium]
MSKLKIGLALSGGGSRAIAFHLGCLRALHDRGVLEKVELLSGVSGGSVIAALYAYSDDPFAEFDKRVEKVLRRGMVWGIAREIFLSRETPRILAAVLTSGFFAIFGTLIWLIVSSLGLFGIGGSALSSVANAVLAPVPRFASRTTAFENHLRRRYFSNQLMDEVRRPGLNVVINAAELRTETAFRFGSCESGCWRYGQLVDTPAVAMAVAASAAFPAALPALDQTMTFTRNGVEAQHRVLITDGGVYDNLGVFCMEPGRPTEFTSNGFLVDFIIACDAGQGTPSGGGKSYFWPSRMLATIHTIHRRTQTLTLNQLHRWAGNGDIAGFLLPYLGQIDGRLPYRPADLVRREDTFSYPTNFSSMTSANLALLSRRGEQLTNLLIDAYAPHL